MSRAPAATEIPFRSFRRPSGLSVLRATEDLTTPCASALVAPAEQRGAGCGDGHEDNGRHGAHLQPFSEDDQAGEGGYGGVETHQDAEDTSREFAQGFELQRVRDGRGEHRHAEAGEEELRIEQGVACACYPERKEDERPYAERDYKPRPTRESAPRAGGEEDVGGPQASGQEREGHTHRSRSIPPSTLRGASRRIPAAASTTHSRSSNRREPATATPRGPTNSSVTATPRGMRSKAR